LVRRTRRELYGARKASGLWRINASGHIRTTYQYKVNSGASDLVSRAVASAGLGGPRPLITNIAVPTLAAGRQALHFLPDRVLAREGKQFASFSYRALNASAKASRFIESARPPRDGQQVDVTWQYANVKVDRTADSRTTASCPSCCTGKSC